ncbi:MAG: GHKL domain-containing protein [Bacteroidetes bacterium]|jgi:sensor histidine kinase YesM|nr:GHKL domain-containing protein [Bacteroidota bacterium]
MIPLFKNTRLIIAYAAFWLFICCSHFTLLFFAYEIPLTESIIDSLVFNILFAIIGIGIWFPIYFSSSEERSLFLHIIQHLAYSVLTIGIWISIGFYIINSIFAQKPDVMEFISMTIPWRITTGILLYSLIVLFYYLVIYYKNYRDKQEKETELRALIRESELKTLKSQINPHFLFNSLNSISSLTMIMPEKAQEMVIKLSEFMRYSLAKKDEQLVTLEKEINNINRYLDIEKIRFGSRLNIDKEIHQQCRDASLPALILQPIIENAIKYGVYESTDQSHINITCTYRHNMLKVKISNTYDADFITKQGEGFGLLNISKRLQLIYGRPDLMKIEKTETTFTINLFIPQHIHKTQKDHGKD